MSLHSPAMLQPSRLSEAMELVKKELRIYSSLQTASGPQLSVSTKYAPTQLRAFLEAKYANQRQHQSPPHIQQAWVEQFEEEIEQQELEPVRTYQHTQGQVLQTEDPDEQSAVSEEEDRQTDALKLMLQAQIKSQNFLEQEVERLTVELNEKTRHEFESRTPARPAPSPSPARSRAQKIPNARTMPVEEKKETIRKQALVKLPVPKRLADLQEQPKKSTGKPDFYLSPPKASVHLSRSGLKAQDKKVDLESAKRLNEADKRLMQTLRGVMREKEREKMKEALLAKKRREARLRAGALRGPTQLLRPTTKTVQKVVSVKKNTATPIKKAPLLPKKALPQLPQKGDVPPEKKQASFAAPHSPIVSKQESKKYAKVVIQPAAIVIQEVVEEDKENSDTQELSQHLIQFDNETEWMMQGLKDEVKINRKEHISKKIMSTEEGCQTEPVHWQELEKVYDEDGPTTEKSLQPEWIINNDDGFRQVLNVPTLDQSHASTSLDHQTPSILDFDIPRNALFAEDAEAFCFTRSAAGATEDSKPNISALTTTVRPKLSLSKKSSERIAKGRQCFIDCMEVWIGTLHDDKAISPWDVLTRLSNEILDEYLHAECSHLFQVSDTYVDALLDDELSPGGVDA